MIPFIQNHEPGTSSVFASAGLELVQILLQIDPSTGLDPQPVIMPWHTNGNYVRKKPASISKLNPVSYNFHNITIFGSSNVVLRCFSRWECRFLNVKHHERPWWEYIQVFKGVLIHCVIPLRLWTHQTVQPATTVPCWHIHILTGVFEMLCHWSQWAGALRWFLVIVQYIVGAVLEPSNHLEPSWLRAWFLADKMQWTERREHQHAFSMP